MNMATKIKYYTQPWHEPKSRCVTTIKPWALDKARKMANTDQVPLIKAVTDAVMNEYSRRYSA